jgi:hypothetical protein
MQTIFVSLSNGGCVAIDDADLIIVSPYSWYSINSKAGVRYAKTGTNVRMHRLILGVTDSSVVVDHINGDGLDNRRGNLRAISVSDNVKNRQQSRNPSNKCPGVWREKGKWRACLTIDYRQQHLGFFERHDDAVAAVNRKRIEIGRPPVFID